MWWWTKVRRANIPHEHRELFDRLGATVVALMLTSGYGPAVDELRSVYYDKTVLTNAVPWLTERSDVHERREDRLETVEISILGFLIVSVVLDVLLWAK